MQQPSDSVLPVGPARPAASGHRRLSLVLTACCVVSACATYRVFTAEVEIGTGLAARLGLIRVALCVALTMQGIALWLTWRGRLGNRPATRLRVLFYVVVLATIAYLVFLQPFWRFYFDIATTLTLSVFATIVVAQPGLTRIVPRRVARTLDVVLFNVCAIVVASELGLRFYASVFPSPLLSRVDSSMIERLDRYRMEPGQLYMGYPINEKGFYDAPFARPEAGKQLVVSISDSFSYGVVPHRMHFTTVCERESPRFDVYNVGVGGIGPSEYIHLLETTVLPLRPDAVVVNIFVGNDVAEAGKARVGDLTLRKFFDRGNVLLYMLPRRLVRLGREKRFLAGAVVGSAQGSDGGRAVTPEAIRKHFPWVFDPMLEEPRFSEQGFLDMEVKRARSVQPNDKAFARLDGDLNDLRRICGKTPLLILIIPDEFQVEDALWRRVEAAAGRGLVRDYAQQRIKASCRELDLPCLDLLPRLRAVPPLADRRRHVYHARDSHFNARGNAVAGKALAGFLEAKLKLR